MLIIQMIKAFLVLRIRFQCNLVRRGNREVKLVELKLVKLSKDPEVTNSSSRLLLTSMALLRQVETLEARLLK